MIEKIKSKLLAIVKAQGYELEDNGFYREEFPFLMLRLSHANKIQTRDMTMEVIDFTIDIFSTYNGEKEIIDIQDKITNPILNECNGIPEVIFSSLKLFKIMEDKSTGTTKKHGILVYRFITTFAES